MKESTLRAPHPVAGEEVDRICPNLAVEDKTALCKIAEQKRSSIGWVIRDAIPQYLAEESKKSEG